LKLALCYILSLVVYDILSFVFFFFMQKASNCDFLEWADKDMSAYEKRLTQHLKEMVERLADNDRVEELIEKKYKEQLAQHLKEMVLQFSLHICLVG
jgi:ABC-type bacteriocin/lantibiotic exporter with double-glycine peptidase domain